ncbi:GIY-YIG nuclease family protein, partial [Enterobacter cloacae complex sp. 2DZ2F20B]|uniref:GIY-YIG nuclease family protein n=1 Tax=Enterobacter cloacae complex sp. 2DZ2F20B TaxID=2511993 RepID=UPI001026C232
LLKLQNAGYKISFRTNNSLHKLINNSKDKSPKKSNSGVYMLSCSDCPLVYIGQTGRKFEEWIKEHKSAYVNKKSNSTNANHLIQDHHNFNDEFKILHIENKGAKRFRMSGNK